MVTTGLSKQTWGVIVGAVLLVIVAALLATGFGVNRLLRLFLWDESARERLRREEAERRRQKEKEAKQRAS